jgi:dethiobiotin synthetase
MRRTNIQHHNSSPRGVFITATDTGVGKTFVTAALVSHLRQRGINIGVMKPIETGVSRSTRARSDGARLRRAAECHDPMTEVSPYVFRLPMAPLSAARAEQQTIRLGTILRALHALCQKHDFVAVEGAGGVHVPITDSLDGLDLIQRMGLPVIVVGRSGLGGINHALLTLHALRQRKINVIALVLNQPQPVRMKIARMQEQSTLTLLQRLANVPVVGPVPFCSRIQQDWNDGLISLAWTVEIMKLAKLVTASGRENS